MGVRHLTGTSWHVEVLGSGDERRRHRSRCQYFNRNTRQCTCSSSPCFSLRCSGSDHCLYYKEPPEEEAPKPSENRKANKNIHIQFYKGQEVQHAVHGKGKVIAVDSKRITVQFEAQTITFSTQIVQEKHLLN